MNSETEKSEIRALVISGDAGSRHATMRALMREGFECDSVNNGELGLAKLESAAYDVVAIDVGSCDSSDTALAIKVVSMPHRPIVVVLTKTAEPKIAATLRAQGVDAIYYKPIAFRDFARSVHTSALARREKARTTLTAERLGGMPEGGLAANVARAELAIRRVSAFADRFAEAPNDYDGFHTISGGEIDMASLVDSIQTNSQLAREILRLANGMLFRLDPTSRTVGPIGQLRSIPHPPAG